MSSELEVMHAMIRAKIGRVGVYVNDDQTRVKGKCKHDVVEFSASSYTVLWRENGGWKGCAQCIITCSAILEDPDMPTESEELALRAELLPTRWPLPPPIALMAVLFASLALGAFIAL